MVSLAVFGQFKIKTYSVQLRHVTTDFIPLYSKTSRPKNCIVCYVYIKEQLKHYLLLLQLINYLHAISY